MLYGLSDAWRWVIVRDSFNVEFVGKVGLHEHLLLRPLSFMIARKVSFMEMKSGYIGQCLYARSLKGGGLGVEKWN